MNMYEMTKLGVPDMTDEQSVDAGKELNRFQQLIDVYADCGPEGLVKSLRQDRSGTALFALMLKLELMVRPGSVFPKFLPFTAEQQEEFFMFLDEFSDYNPPEEAEPGQPDTAGHNSQALSEAEDLGPNQCQLA